MPNTCQTTELSGLVFSRPQLPWRIRYGNARFLFNPCSSYENDAGKTANSIVCRKMAVTQLVIICRKMAIIQLVMDKCCSSDEIFDPFANVGDDA